ncbi:DUF3987 domain-containing protein [Xanthomonas albilineans]|uniref:DUF3987 domain-containing protein n=1 Tax=Xanthomonas albilineans (strain GPE PC73 / CFBP 7063) TaxID=380358 RepID=D2U8M4_XANAP|nr:YfjI family protein [Xanthomonas albilineans]QHQ28580.1 hypothetical protein XaFJ1_GM001845 [Xanthomonas albilineans]CBA16350.1 conserved hypothetical protein [Xanthomonas albilineans GPE PC73]
MNAIPVETPHAAARRILGHFLAEGYLPTGLHEYRDAQGNQVFWRARCKHPDGRKEIRPFRWNGTRYVPGEPPAPPEGKVLYQLPELLAANVEAIVYVAEGEACADALTALDLLATTSGSSSSAGGTDWTPLRGRRVRLWPDNDASGRKYAVDVAERLRALGCAVECIDVDTLGLPEKGDCVDWLAARPDADAVAVNALPLAETAHAGGSVQHFAPAPLPDPLPAVPVFNPALLPDCIRTWCTDAADSLQVPLDFTAVPAMVGLAAALGGRHLAVRLRRHGHWYERPILWGCVIGRPSSGKSPALSPARRLLESVTGPESDEYERARKMHEGKAILADARKAQAKEEARKAIKKGMPIDPEALGESARFDDEAPTEPRLVVNDATVEKLGELLNENPRGLIQFRDELAGWLASLDREGREQDRAFWLECWNGTGPYTSDRIGRGTIRIEACAVSILGGMQPGKLAEYVRGAVRGGFSDDGLMQRFQLAVYPDLPASWRYTDRPLDREAEDRARAAFNRLRALNPADVEAATADACDVPFLRLSDDAQGLFVEWQTDLMQRLRAGDEPPFMESHLAKYPALAGRLALVLHLADNGTGAVSADAMLKAFGWCEHLERHARRVYAPATDNGLTAAHLLLRKRDSLPDGFTARDVYRKCWAGLDDPDTVAEALAALADHHHVIELAQMTRGRPSVAYRWAA